MTATTALSFDQVDESTLHLRGVLDTMLPRELGTDDAPDVYTVSAVFSRRVSGQEQGLIELPAVTELLADRGYPGIRLTVEDRRLVIANTNLAMLEAGLAREIAAVLRDVATTIATERTRRADELAGWRATEVQRAATVKTESDRVRFE
ncbi:hypothetical protein [Cellulosimicrobium sp. Marseille-Q4280]|jgi:hypothetical protein|uniref:hypothetical protein n=1 Tax=Cellulosimicrobium sp. Marseille-Q4280 TaxID=2937992 RepID=UPI00203C3B94|nr:hypothetical protein [Cellulosimicrobium sp. Marseille-Q4280]